MVPFMVEYALMLNCKGNNIDILFEIEVVE